MFQRICKLAGIDHEVRDQKKKGDRDRKVLPKQKKKSCEATVTPLVRYLAELSISGSRGEVFCSYFV